MRLATLIWGVLLLCPSARRLSRDSLTNTVLLCNKYVVFRDTVRGSRIRTLHVHRSVLVTVCMASVSSKYNAVVSFDVITSFSAGYIVGVGRVRTVIRSVLYDVTAGCRL